MALKPVVTVVGCGRTGGALGLALQEAGYQVAAAWSRTRAGRQRAHRLLGSPVLTDPAEVAHLGDVVLVAVPDDAIGEVAAAIAQGVRPNAYVAHTSGAESVDVLGPAKDAGARTGSLHPLQTIPSARRGAESLKGAPVAVTSDDRDRVAFFRFARAWGGRPFVLRDEAKTLYHAAAVFASNYVTTTVWAAHEVMRAAGLGDPSSLLAPLLRTTVDNVVERGPASAITGPIARGDVQTVRRHLEALGSDHVIARVRDAYRTLAALTAELVGAGAIFEDVVA